MTDRLATAAAPAGRPGRYPAQGHQHDHPTVPKGALWAAAAIMLITVAGGVAARFADVGAVRLSEPAPALTRIVSFHEAAGGGLEVWSPAASGAAVAAEAAAAGEASSQLVTRLEATEAGFVLGVLRAMRRDRAPAGVSPTAPYALGLATNGRLTLADPQTGRRIELRGFGVDHYRTFRSLIDGAAAGGAAGAP